jgi:hypothetical protein
LFLEFLGREPNQEDLIIAQDLYGDTLDTPKEIGDFITNSKQEILNRQNLDVNKLFEGDNFPTLDQIRQAKIDGQARVDQEVEDKAAANAEGRPGPGQILGIPSLARQTQSDLTFAPLRRGLAQLRTETYSPGLTSGQRALVGSGFTPEQLRQLTTKIVQEGEAAGRTQEQIIAEIEHLADIGGVSPAEVANVLGQSTKVMQDTYNQRRPGGIFATSAPTAPKPFALPEDFALQTGAYGAPTPTFFTPTPAKTTSPSESSSANANQPGSIGGSGGDGEVLGIRNQVQGEAWVMSRGVERANEWTRRCYP